MKILFYELRKLLSKKSFFLCFALCFVSVLFFAYSNANASLTSTYHNEFNKLIVNDKSVEENYELLMKRNEDLRMLLNQRNKLDDLYQEQNTSSKEEIKVEIDKGMSVEGSLEIAAQALHYIENIRNYKQYNDAIQSSNLDVSIKNEYKNIQQENIKAVNYMPIELLNDQYIAFVLSVLVCLFSIYILNNYEKETNTSGICFLSNKGKQSLIFNKLFLSIIIGIITICIFNFVILIYNFAVFGGIDFSANIQSLPSCYESPFNMTILSAIMLGFIKQMIVMIIMICIYYLLYIQIKKDTIATFILGSFLLMEFIFYQVISEHSNLMILKTWNIFNLASFLSFFDKFITYQIFGIEINAILLLLIIFIIIVSLTTLCLFRYSKSWINGSKLFQNDFITKRGAHISLFKHEIYKQLILGKSLIIIVVMLLFCGYVSSQFAIKMKDMNFTNIVNQYELYGGKLTNTKIQKIETRHEEIENKVNEFRNINKAHENKEISDNEYHQIENNFMQELYDDRVFENFYLDYVNHIGNSIVYANGFQAIFSINNYDRDMVYAAFFIFISILLFSGLYSIDKDHNQEKLYILTRNGKNKRIKIQRRIGYFWIGIVFVLLLLLTFGLFYLVYPMNGWNYEMSAILRINTNVEIVNDNYLNSSILMNFVQLQLFRIVILSILFELTLTLSKLLRNRKNTLIILLIIVLFPFLLAEMGFTFFRYISLIHLLSANLIFHTTNGSLLLYAVLSLIGIKVLLKLLENKIDSIIEV